MKDKPAPPIVPARIHLLPAKEAPVVIVLRRKPSDVCHVLRWDTETGELRGGSWFRGRLYEHRADVSFDGKYMVYMAAGAKADETWNGVCEPPFLRTLLDWPNHGTWHGGGVFTAPNLLSANPGYSFGDMRSALENSKRMGKSLPFEVAVLPPHGYGEDEGVLYPRLARDGFVRLGEMPKEEERLATRYQTVCQDDPGWECRPTPRHPALRLRYRGYNVRLNRPSRVFEFDLPEYPELLDPDVDWANYDFLGQLVFARAGSLYLYRLEDIALGVPTSVIDLEEFAPPERVPGAKRTSMELAPQKEFLPLIITGRVEEQVAQVLILPQSPAPWVREIHDLAGGNLPRDLAAGEPILVTSGYYLRYHAIVHVDEPRPKEGVDALRAMCVAAFERGAYAGRTIATRPIGLDSGWAEDVAVRETYEAAKEIMRGGQEVFIVAEDERTQARYRELIDKG